MSAAGAFLCGGQTLLAIQKKLNGIAERPSLDQELMMMINEVKQPKTLRSARHERERDG